MRQTPDEKQIKELLENVKPTSSTRLDQRLSNAPWTQRAVNRRRFGISAILVVLVAVSIVAATPQGRAWAQGVIRFFTRAESDTLPIATPSDDIAWDFNLSLDEVRAQANFDIVEPAWLPNSLSFDGAAFDAEYDIVRLRWTSVNTNGLVLTEQPLSGTVNCQICEIVGANAEIQPVQVGGVQAEYVVGVWKANDSGEWGWDTDPWLQRIRWQRNGIAYELLYMGAPESMTRADLLAVAGSMGSAEAVQPAVLWGLTVAEAQEMAGFDVRVPDCLPPGYGLKTVIFNPQNGAVIQLYEFSPRQAGESFALIQSPTRPNELVGSNATVETLDVSGTTVEYVSGMWFSGIGANAEQWISGQPVHTFIWQEGDFYFTLQFLVNDTFSPAYLSKQDMITEIEGVMGLRTRWPDQVNLNYLTSYEDVEQAAGFDILTPSALPEGFIFSYGVYEPENQRVVLIYHPEDGSSDASLVIFEILGATPANSWDGFPAGAVETVSIGTATGTFVHGAIVDGVYDSGFGMSVHWQTDGLYVQVRFTRGGSPAQLDEDAILSIARSMK